MGLLERRACGGAFKRLNSFYRATSYTLWNIVWHRAEKYFRLSC